MTDEINTDGDIGEIFSEISKAVTGKKLTPEQMEELKRLEKEAEAKRIEQEKRNKELQAMLDNLWEDDLKTAFNHPFVGKPKASDLTGIAQGTAAFNPITNEISISEPFVREIAPHFGRRQESQKVETAARVLVGHETGHYVYFPRELSNWLYMLSIGERTFGEEGVELAKIYSEVPNELAVIGDDVLKDNSIFELREAMNSNLVEEAAKYREQAETLKAEGKFDEAREKRIKAKSAELSAGLQRLYLGLYQQMSKQEGWIEPTEEEIGYLDELGKIDYLTQDINRHVGNMIRFANVMRKVFPKMPGRSGGDPYGDLKRLPRKDIEKALREIISKHGKKAYERVKKFVEKHCDFDDPYSTPTRSRGKHAGTGKGEFKFFDEEIPFYRRWSSNYPVFIHQKEAIVDEVQTYKGGLKEYEVGDPLQDTDVFASKGKIGIPGVSKIRIKDSGVHSASRMITPGLNVVLDTSGSMRHPKDKSYSVLGTFILGRNYERNGALVGGVNISTDMAWTPLSRELDDFYSLMCGYWGGGTVFNTEKLRKILLEMRGGSGIMFEEGEIERIVHTLPERMKREVEEKRISPDVSGLKGGYEMVDNVMFTDGYIYNIDEVIGHLNTLGQYTRNFIFINNEDQYGEWRQLELPNTEVFLAEKAEDYVNLALGRSKQFAREIAGSYEGGTSSFR